MNFEIMLLNSALEEGDMVACLDAGVDTLFYSHKDIWNFIVEHHGDYKKFPSKDTVKEKFKDFDVVPVPEPFQYYVDDARRQSLGQNLNQAMMKTVDLNKNEGSKAALTYLQSQVSKLSKFNNTLKDTDLADWEDRYEDLKYRAANKEGDVIGVPSRIKPIDTIFGGWQPGDFVVIIGWTGVGKSFIATLFAVNAWLEGYRPLFISLEMNKMQVAHRVDTLLNKGEFFTNEHLTKADEGIVDIYGKWAEETYSDKQSFHLVTAEGLDTADQNLVQAKIEQYQPDLVILDYHGLFEYNGRSGNETEKSKNLSKEFKRIAVRNSVPIIDIAAVTMGDGHEERPPTLDEVAWSKQLAYDADLVLAVHRPRDSNIFSVISRKERRCNQFAFNLEWDLNAGRVRDIYEDVSENGDNDW